LRAGRTPLEARDAGSRVPACSTHAGVGVERDVYIVCAGVRVCVYVYMDNQTNNGAVVSRVGCTCAPARPRGGARSWPLHDITITNIVWFTAYKRGVGKRAYSAQWSCNSIAIG